MTLGCSSTLIKFQLDLNGMREYYKTETETETWNFQSRLLFSALFIFAGDF